MLKSLTVGSCAHQNPCFSQPVEVTYFLNMEHIRLSRCNTHCKLNCARLITPGVTVKICHSWTNCFMYNVIPTNDTVYAIFI